MLFPEDDVDEDYNYVEDILIHNKEYLKDNEPYPSLIAKKELEDINKSTFLGDSIHFKFLDENPNFNESNILAGKKYFTRKVLEKTKDNYNMNSNTNRSEMSYKSENEEDHNKRKKRKKSFAKNDDPKKKTFQSPIRTRRNERELRSNSKFDNSMTAQSSYNDNLKISNRINI